MTITTCCLQFCMQIRPGLGTSSMPESVPGVGERITIAVAIQKYETLLRSDRTWHRIVTEYLLLCVDVVVWHNILTSNAQPGNLSTLLLQNQTWLTCTNPDFDISWLLSVSCLLFFFGSCLSQLSSVSSSGSSFLFLPVTGDFVNWRLLDSWGLWTSRDVFGFLWIMRTLPPTSSAFWRAAFARSSLTRREITLVNLTESK